ncbi:MAG: molybdenum cofactor cytidylyltransferase [Gammaproteobacteria bacterium]|jgi:molybdenum cofactor cytidylyltransferase
MIKSSRVDAVLLAAGRSTRMGPSNKLLQSINDLTLLQWVLNVAVDSNIRQTLVVTGHESQEVAREISGLINQSECKVIHNPDYNQGIGNSIGAGIRHLPDNSEGVLIMLADMPDIKSSTINHLIDSFYKTGKSRICVPVFQGKRGNPVLWPALLFSDLAGIKGDRGGRTLFKQYESCILNCEVPDDSIHKDIDTPEQLTSRQQSSKNTPNQ